MTAFFMAVVYGIIGCVMTFIYFISKDALEAKKNPGEVLRNGAMWSGGFVTLNFILGDIHPLENVALSALYFFALGFLPVLFAVWRFRGRNRGDRN